MPAHHVTRAAHTETIIGTRADCMAALLDFESYPEWQSAVVSIEVAERYSDGGALVHFEINARIRRVKYSLRYHVDGERMWWDYAGGDVDSIEGDYTFEETPDGTVRATYRLAIDPGRFVPGSIKRALTEGIMKRSVRELKSRVEST